MTIATSRNLTIVGIGTIVGAIASVVVALFDADPTTVPDWGVAATAVMAGVGMILGKGAAVTGGTVPATPEAQSRVAPPPAS